MPSGSNLSEESMEAIMKNEKSMVEFLLAVASLCEQVSMDDSGLSHEAQKVHDQLNAAIKDNCERVTHVRIGDVLWSTHGDLTYRVDTAAVRDCLQKNVSAGHAFYRLEFPSATDTAKPSVKDEKIVFDPLFVQFMAMASDADIDDITNEYHPKAGIYSRQEARAEYARRLYAACVKASKPNKD